MARVRYYDSQYFRTWLRGRWVKVERIEGAEYCGELCPMCNESEMRVYKGVTWVGKPLWALKCPTCFYRSHPDD